MLKRTCAHPDCGNELQKKPGRGRWPVWCEDHKAYARRASAKRAELSPSRLCSVEGCGRGHQARGYCGAHYNKILRPNRHVTHIVCETCGKQHTTKRTNGKYCSLECRDIGNRKNQVGVYNPAHRRQIRGPHYKPHFSVWVLECVECGVQFNDVYRRRILCSESCRAARNERLYRERTGEKPQSYYLQIMKQCATCGVDFRSEYANAKYCSRSCAPKWSNSDWISNKRRWALYKRDNFICYICGIKVNKRADMERDPDAPTLDHVIPRSKGGTDDESNLKTCCRACNSLKSDRDISLEQGALFGLGRD